MTDIAGAARMDILAAPPEERLGMAAAARRANMSIASVLRRVRDRRLTVVRGKDGGWETIVAAVDAMIDADTERALGKLAAAPAPIRTPASKSRGYAAAVRKLQAAGVIPKATKN